MKNFVQNGNAITVTAGGDVNAGDAIVLGGNLPGVAATDAATGETFELITEGVFELTKVTADVATAGDQAYLNGSGEVSVSDTGAQSLGVFVEDAANGDTTCKVRLMSSLAPSTGGA